MMRGTYIIAVLICCIGLANSATIRDKDKATSTLSSNEIQEITGGQEEIVTKYTIDYDEALANGTTRFLTLHSRVPRSILTQKEKKFCPKTHKVINIGRVQRCMPKNFIKCTKPASSFVTRAFKKCPSGYRTKALRDNYVLCEQILKTKSTYAATQNVDQTLSRKKRAFDCTDDMLVHLGSENICIPKDLIQNGVTKQALVSEHKMYHY